MIIRLDLDKYVYTPQKQLIVIRSLIDHRSDIIVVNHGSM